MTILKAISLFRTAVPRRCYESHLASSEPGIHDPLSKSNTTSCSPCSPSMETMRRQSRYSASSSANPHRMASLVNLARSNSSPDPPPLDLRMVPRIIGAISKNPVSCRGRNSGCKARNDACVCASWSPTSRRSQLLNVFRATSTS